MGVGTVVPHDLFLGPGLQDCGGSYLTPQEGPGLNPFWPPKMRGFIPQTQCLLLLLLLRLLGLLKSRTQLERVKTQTRCSPSLGSTPDPGRPKTQLPHWRRFPQEQYEKSGVKNFFMPPAFVPGATLGGRELPAFRAARRESTRRHDGMLTPRGGRATMPGGRAEGIVRPKPRR